VKVQHTGFIATEDPNSSSGSSSCKSSIEGHICPPRSIDRSQSTNLLLRKTPQPFSFLHSKSSRNSYGAVPLPLNKTRSQSFTPKNSTTSQRKRRTCSKRRTQNPLHSSHKTHLTTSDNS
jgi:hypothetical protein